MRPAYCRPPVEADWKANAVVDGGVTVTDQRLGDAQGVSYRKDRLYFYGDVCQAKPRVGIIREYTLDLNPTGRDIRLTRDGKPLLLHPTGLTWDAEFGCFLGDTVNKVATIYKLDWQRALQDGNLDGAVLAVIHDDAATNGCRPEFVALRGRRLLATADYGNVRPAVRLYDPERLPVRPAILGPRRVRGGDSLRTVQPEPSVGPGGRPAHLRAERHRGSGLEARRVRSGKGRCQRLQTGLGPSADVDLPAPQRAGRLAAAARRARGVRHIEPEGQHSPGQEPLAIIGIGWQ